jgi:hypothetical protein
MSRRRHGIGVSSSPALPQRAQRTRRQRRADGALAGDTSPPRPVGRHAHWLGWAGDLVGFHRDPGARIVVAATAFELRAVRATHDERIRSSRSGDTICQRLPAHAVSAGSLYGFGKPTSPRTRPRPSKLTLRPKP